MSKTRKSKLAATLIAIAAAAAPAAGCGSAGDGNTTAQVGAWDVGEPYLPPIDPAAYAREKKSAVATAPKPARKRTPKAKPRRAPATSGGDTGAPSDAEIAADLREAYGDASGADLDRAAIDANGLAVIPETAPPKLIALMHGANEVAKLPYVYGGGHGRFKGETWTDSAYDCSGSVSYALAAAGYLDGPMVSGALARWGKPGPGKWVTIYAHGGHVFMTVAGLRFDTSGRQRTGTRWQVANARSYAGFTVRHPPGL